MFRIGWEERPWLAMTAIMMIVYETSDLMVLWLSSRNRLVLCGYIKNRFTVRKNIDP
jgi:hypothetical protein